MQVSSCLITHSWSDISLDICFFSHMMNYGYIIYSPLILLTCLFLFFDYIGVYPLLIDKWFNHLVFKLLRNAFLPLVSPSPHLCFSSFFFLLPFFLGLLPVSLGLFSPRTFSEDFLNQGILDVGQHFSGVNSHFSGPVPLMGK